MPKGDSTSATQTAIHARLLADVPLAALVAARIYDHPAIGTEFPYVEIASIINNDYHLDPEYGSELTITLRAWSRGKGKKEVQDLCRFIKDSLHEATYVITGHTLINSRHLLSNYFNDADAQTMVGEIQFRIVTQEN